MEWTRAPPLPAFGTLSLQGSSSANLLSDTDKTCLCLIMAAGRSSIVNAFEDLHHEVINRREGDLRRGPNLL